MSEKPKTSERIKEILSWFHSIYFLLMVLALVASIIPQIAPVFFNPLAVEIAKYGMVVVISFIGSYLLFKKMETKIEKSKMTPLGTRIDTATQQIEEEIKKHKRDTEKELEEHKKKTEQNFAELNTRIAQFTDFRIKQEQEHSLLNGKFSQIYGMDCPICKRWIDLKLPNTVVSGVHSEDGQPSKSTMRDTYEMSVQCPYCRSQLHIDISHDDLFKVKDGQ